jgi:hypothetical protein
VPLLAASDTYKGGAHLNYNGIITNDKWAHAHNMVAGVSYSNMKYAAITSMLVEGSTGQSDSV